MTATRPSPVDWRDLATLCSRKYTCAHCGTLVSSNVGYWANEAPDGMYIYICPGCGLPTFFPWYARQIPAPAFGSPVPNLPPEVHSLYEEARASFSAAAYTSAVLTCRKILMNVSVAHGAPPGASFAKYVDFLVDHRLVTPNCKPWVDRIREKGNEANHEIAVMTSDDAKEILTFLEMLLRLLYDYPQRAGASSSP